MAGGNLDVIGRLFAQALTEELGQAVVVDNRPGANGNTGTETAVRSPADGYTLAMVSAGTMAINPSLYRDSMLFNPEKDLVAVSLVASGPMVLEVNAALPVRDVGELIAYARANPGKLNFGSGGNGTLSHLSLEMLRASTGVNKRLAQVGSEAVGSTPEQFASIVRAERVRWSEIVKVSGARVD